MYQILLFSHSWTRWLVLAVGLASLISLVVNLRGTTEKRSVFERILQGSFVGLYDLQFTFGLTLYFGVSPFVKGVFQLDSSNPLFQFWAMGHITAMTAGSAILHIANVKSKKQPTVQKTRKTLLVGNILWWIIICLAIPWPWLSYGRPFFRGF